MNHAGTDQQRFADRFLKGISHSILSSLCFHRDDQTSLRRPSIGRSSISDRHAAGYPSRDLQEVGFHVDDLVFAVPFAGKDVFLAVGLDPYGAVDEAVLVGPGAQRRSRSWARRSLKQTLRCGIRRRSGLPSDRALATIV